METKLIRKLVKYKLQEIKNIEDFLVNYLTTLSEDEQNKFFEVDERIVSKKYKIYYPPNYPGRIFLVGSEDDINVLGWSPDGNNNRYRFYKGSGEVGWWSCKKSTAVSIAGCPDYDFRKGYFKMINPVGEVDKIPETFEEAESLLKTYEYLWENW